MNAPEQTHKPLLLLPCCLLDKRDQIHALFWVLTPLFAVPVS